MASTYKVKYKTIKEVEALNEDTGEVDVYRVVVKPLNWNAITTAVDDLGGNVDEIIAGAVNLFRDAEFIKAIEENNTEVMVQKVTLCIVPIIRDLIPKVPTLVPRVASTVLIVNNTDGVKQREDEVEVLLTQYMNPDLALRFIATAIELMGVDRLIEGFTEPVGAVRNGLSRKKKQEKEKE